jgi:polyhydroxyalkanoate synthesis regulator phasin
LGVESEQEAQSEATRYVDQMVNRGEITKAEGKALLTQLTNQSQKNLEEFQGRIKQTIEETLRKSTNLNQIEDNISRLHERLDRLELQVQG